MRFIRTLALALALALAFSVSPVDGQHARAQSVEDAQEQAATASGFVDSAIADRAAIELDLVNTIARINELSEELSQVSVALDNLRERLAFADVELDGIEEDIELRAVDAYMSAFSGSAMTVVNSDNVEQALVTGIVVEDLIGSDREAIDTLVVKKRGLEQLRQDFLAQQEAVAEKQTQFDDEKEHLAVLFDQADAAVAAAVRDADAADAAYREALDAVEAAQAKAAEEERQEENPPPTTTTPTTAPPGTSATTTTVTPPVTTTTGPGGGGYPWTPPPAVEQWRGLVSQHFPANRVDQALHIISCESGGDPEAYNPYSGASGLFQFVPSTWASTSAAAGFAGASPFDPVANSASAAWLANRYEELGQYYWTAWNCKRVLY